MCVTHYSRMASVAKNNIYSPFFPSLFFSFFLFLSFSFGARFRHVAEIPPRYHENGNYFVARIFLKRFRNFRAKLMEFEGESYEHGLEHLP